MFEILLISIGLVLIIEGILYFFLSNNLKKYLDKLSLINPQTIKNISSTNDDGDTIINSNKLSKRNREETGSK